MMNSEACHGSCPQATSSQAQTETCAEIVLDLNKRYMMCRPSYILSMPSARRVRGLIEEDAGLLTRITSPGLGTAP